MGTIYSDSTGTFSKTGAPLNCQSADLSVLYYDGSNPCVADLACQVQPAPPAGGSISIDFHLEADCGFTQTLNHYATATVYYANGDLLCSDEWYNLGSPQIELTSSKCNLLFRLATQSVIRIDRVQYANGYVDTVERWPSMNVNHIGSCDGDNYSQDYSATYTYDGSDG